MKNRHRNKKLGFTLVEILIVCAIIGLILAFSIPSLLRSRIEANEAAAQASLKTIVSALTIYRTGNMTYPNNLLELGSVANEGLGYLNDALAQGTYKGYIYSMEFVTPHNFLVRATPEVPNVTGVRNFTVDQSGVILVASTDGSPGGTSPNPQSDGGPGPGGQIINAIATLIDDTGKPMGTDGSPGGIKCETADCEPAPPKPQK